MKLSMLSLDVYILQLIIFSTLFFGNICSSAKVKSDLSKPPIKTTTPSNLTVGVITWNLAEKQLTEMDFLKSFQTCDIVAIGVQECEDIRPRRKEGRRSRKLRALQRKMIGKDFKCIAQSKLGGIQLAVFARTNLSAVVQGVEIIEVACGVGNVLMNKGAICALLRMKGKTIALINSHLAAHQNKVEARNSDFHRIMNQVVMKAKPTWLTSTARRKRKQQESNQDLLSTEFGETYKSFTKMISSVVGVDIGADEPTPTLAPKRRRKVCVKSISGGSKRAQSSASAARSVSAKILSSEQKVKVGADREPDYVLDLSYAGRNRKKSKSSRRSSDSNSGDDDDDKEESDVELDAKTRNLLDSHPEQDADCPFDALIFFGDLNYRLDFPRFEAELLKERIQDISVGDTVEARALQEDVRAVLEYDQLTREKCRGRAFRGFSEGRIDFAPTFKYDRGSDQFDSSAKGRAPAWTDRILFKVWNRTTTRDSDGIKRAAKRSDPTAPEDISNSSTQGDQKSISISPPLLTLLEYNSIDNRHSDHRPVCSKFNLFL